MQNFVFVGITGIGKTFLELELESKYGFYPWPKYTDRAEKRKEETGTSNIKFVTKEEFDQMQSDFIFTINYLNNRYGWRREDYVSHMDGNITLALPLDALVDFMNRVPKFIPIMLHVELDNFQLIEERVKVREDYENLLPEQQKIVDEKVQERLITARYELQKFSFYQKIIQRYGGRVFTIKDDTTIHAEVIPYILENKKGVDKGNFSDIANKYR